MERNFKYLNINRKTYKILKEKDRNKTKEYVGLEFFYM